MVKVKWAWDKDGLGWHIVVDGPLVVGLAIAEALFGWMRAEVE